MTDALIGKQFNNFRIERLLGRGGMAKVYYGIDVGLNRPVALKVIDERFREDESFSARFVTEALTIATWRHNNIIQVYYAGKEEDIPYYVMEYIEGDDLTYVINSYHLESKQIPYDRTMSILRSIADALDYAHSKDVVHRDVKPSNIMISSDDRVVLMDFGLALDTQKGTIGETFGTPHYIAPEQAQDSSKATSKSDQYALGVIAYEMLTGQIPFDHESAMSVAMMHMTEPPPKPTDINPNLTPEVEKVLLKVLSKQPTERFPSCQAFVETIEQTVLGRPTLIDDVTPTQMGSILINPRAESNTRTVSAKEPLTPPTQVSSSSNRIPLILVGVVILVLLGIGALLAMSSSNNDAQSVTLTEITQTDNAQTAEEATNTPVQPTATQNSDDDVTSTDIPPSPTNHPTVTPVIPTSTPQPTDTEIPPSATDDPTAMPSNTSVPPTRTPQPTNTTNAVASAPTLAYPDGSQIVLYYDDSTFYAWNPSGDRVRAGNFKFEALDNNGNTLANTFDGVSWTQFYSFIDGGNCVKIEFTTGSTFVPPECGNTNSEVNLMSSDDQVFWTGGGNISGFRVLWNDDEIARCEANTGQCTFNIP